MDPKIQLILDNFEQINQIPRCSKNEVRIAAWLAAWARQQGFDTLTDDVGNLVVTVPASKGFEGAPTIILQGHMDMVCEKRPDVEHDFTTDPITHVISDDWLKADGTSLGADNGVALALAMALATDKSIDHPKLELLFTVDEETGLTGANLLDPDMLTGRILINIDSEDEGVFTVGCAGGINSEINLPLTLSPAEDQQTLSDIKVSGLRGGHSGIDINTGRASANKVVARVLDAVLQQMDICLVGLDGGTAHNAIARDAQARIALLSADAEKLYQIVAQMEKIIQNEFAGVENELKIAVAPLSDVPMPQKIVSKSDTLKIINLLMALPHGVIRMSQEAAGLVDTSSNLSRVSLLESGLYILSSQRSVFTSRVKEMARQVAATAQLAGASVKTDNDYPAWQPDPDSELLRRCQNVYKKLFETDPVVEIIHAGLECAVIGDKYPEMDMISIGPTMKNPHSPDERLYIPSILKLWQFSVALLASFAD
jgi:dipeptidase D